MNYIIVDSAGSIFHEECNKLAEDGWYPLFNVIVMNVDSTGEIRYLQQWAKVK